MSSSSEVAEGGGRAIGQEGAASSGESATPASWAPLTVFGVPLRPFLAVATWIIFGIAMILFNKLLLSTWHFPYPFFFTLWHCVFCTAVTQIMVRFPHLLPSPPEEWKMFQSVKEGKITWQIIFNRLTPLAVFHASGLTLGNSAYKFLSVAYIQILKSLSPVMILLVAFMIGKEKPSAIQLGIVSVICGGVVLASTGELQFSLIGFVLQLLAILTDVGRMTLIDILMVDVKLDSLSMLYYLSPLSSVMIFFGFIFFELDENFPWGRIFLDPSFGSALLFSGVLAFCLNIAVFVGVAHSSSVIIGVSGLLKDMILVASSVLFFGSPITLQQIFGYGVSIVGLSYYREFRADPQKSSEKVYAVVARVSAALGVAYKGDGGGGDESESFLGSDKATTA